ncbi:conjugal transfer protein TraH [Campylobacter sp. MOP51]|uniref:conjugal transfer protein TraH n=1 Tax=Campylobacter canis TaxID=3378588 RepID=UPI003C4A04AF
MSKIKKIIATIVSVALFGQSTLFAASVGSPTSFFTDVFGDTMYSNVTAGGFFKSTNPDGSVNEYMTYIPGGVFFRFGAAFDEPEPIFSISQPTSRMGCGGLSVKGMFINILGLDRLAMMLKNAGASLAWGVAVGLFYSLPGVGKAFEFLNTWAKNIQNLLANACQSGYNIGRSVGSMVGLDSSQTLTGYMHNQFKDNALYKSAQDVVGFLDGSDKSIKDSTWGKWLDNFDSNMVFQGFGDYTSAKSPEQIAENWSRLVSQLYVQRSIGTDFLFTLFDFQNSTMSDKRAKFFANLMGSPDLASVPLYQVKKFAITASRSGKQPEGDGVLVFSVDDLIKNLVKTKNTTATSMTLESRIAQVAFATALAKYIGVDVVASDLSSIDNIMRHAIKAVNANGGNLPEAPDTVPGSTGSTPTPASGGKSQQAINLTKDATGKSIHKVDVPGNEEASFIQNFLRVMLTGDGRGGAGTDPTPSEAMSKDAKTNLLNIPALGFGAIAIPAQGTSENNNGDKVFIVFSLDRASMSGISYIDPNSPIIKEGLLARSKKVLDRIVTGYTDPAVGAGGQVDIEKTEDMIWVYNEVYRHLLVIQQSTETDRQDIMNKIASYNAYAVLDSIIKSVFNIQSFSKPIMPVAQLVKGKFIVSGNDTGIIPPNETLYNDAIQKNMTKNVALQKEYNEWLKANSNGLHQKENINNEIERLHKINSKRTIQAAPENPAN